MTNRKDTDIKDINYEDMGSAVLLDRFKVPEIYVDGASQVLMGFPTTKILFHTVIESGEKEIRRACAMLTMDAPSALELALGILESFRQANDVLLKDAAPSLEKKLKALLERIPNEEIQVGVQEKSGSLSKSKSKEKK